MIRIVSPEGRINRLTYALAWLGSAGVLLALSRLDTALGTQFGASSGVFHGLANLALLWPLLAANIKRLHDQDKSGWVVLVFLIPLLGWVLLAAQFLTRGTPGFNDHGEVPGRGFAL